MLDSPALWLAPAAAVLTIIACRKKRRMAKGRRAFHRPSSPSPEARMISAVRHFILKGGEAEFPMDARARRIAAQVIGHDENFQLVRTSFLRACDVLGDAPPPEAVRPVAGYLKHPADVVRICAARTLAKSGSMESVPWVKEALADKVPDVRRAALEGLAVSLKRPGVARLLMTALQPSILAIRLTESDNEAANAVMELFGTEMALQA